MKHCKYCASTVTNLDNFGYCKKYYCFGRSGMADKLNALIQRCGNIWLQPKSKALGIASCVTNNYNGRTRFANDIMRDAEHEFGFVPSEVLDRIPLENQKQWDKNIRW
jgi:hypothetical protein